MRLPKNPIRVKGYRRPRRGNAKGKGLTKSQKKQVVRLVKGQGETKMVNWYQGPITDLSGATGVYSLAQTFGLNQFISSNTTDIFRCIPLCEQGLSDNQRIGQKINPVSLKLHCNVSVTVAAQLAGTSQNLFAVAYLLQHVSLKSYQALYKSNDFTQLLDLGDNSLDRFNGTFTSATLPVAKQYYRLLAKKIIPLRSNGFFGGAGGTAMNNNPHPYTHNWTWDVTKHLPKTLMYPDSDDTTTWKNDPTNSSLFWSCAYYSMDNNLSPTMPVVGILQQYTAIMKFKDM